MSEKTALVVQIKNGKVSTNLDALKAEIEKLVADYQGIEVTAKYVADAKRDRAYLNALAKSIDEQRRFVKREWLKPLDEFEAKVKEVLAPVKEASAHIDEQVKAFEQAKKDEKKQRIVEHWQGCSGILYDVIDFERQVFDEKWLNASVGLGTAYEAIDALIEKVALDEAALTEMALPHADEAKAAYFVTLDLGAAIMRSRELEDQRARVEKFEAEKAQLLAEQSAVPEPICLPEPEPVTAEPVAEPVTAEPVYRWIWEIDATEADIRRIAEYARGLGLTGVARRKKEA